MDLPPAWVQLAVVVGDELREAWRGRWLPAIALVWAIVAFLAARMAIQLAGSAVPAFELASATLFDLVNLLVPLLALVIGATSLASDGDGIEALWLQPMSRGVALLGRTLGQMLSLCGAIALGFVPTFVWIGRSYGPERVSLYGLLVLLALALSIAFLGLGALLSTVLRGRVKAVGAACATWATFGILYDAALLGLAAFADGAWFHRGLAGFMLANPLDTARVAFLLASGARSFAGPAGASLAHTFSGQGGAVLLAVGLVAWMIGPVGVAIAVRDRMDV